MKYIIGIIKDSDFCGHSTGVGNYKEGNKQHDALDRLTAVCQGTDTLMNIKYGSNGNITFKTGAFIMMYNELQHEILRSYLKRYTKRSDAYKDMIAYSISTDNEIAAFYTENNGTIVYYNSNNKNNYSYHPHVYMDNTGKHYIKFNGKAIYILQVRFIHTP